MPPARDFQKSMKYGDGRGFSNFLFFDFRLPLTDMSPLSRLITNCSRRSHLPMVRAHGLIRDVDDPRKCFLACLLAKFSASTQSTPTDRQLPNPPRIEVAVASVGSE